MTPASPAGSGETTLELIRLFVLLVGAAALVTLLARRIQLPYTVALVAFGIAAGILAPLRIEITPQLVLVVLLPALIFEASYQTDFGKLRPSLVGVSLLAGPGVLISASIVAAALHFGAGLALPQAFVVGAMLSATDPAAVIATFKRLRSPRRLATLVEAESVFNDGTGIVVFALAVDFVSRPVGAAEIGLTFVWVTLASTALGAVAGYVASRILPSVGDHLIEISLSVVLAYGTYLAADAFHLSGVISTAVAGIVLGTYGRKNGLSPRTEEALDTVWGVRRLPGHRLCLPRRWVRDIDPSPGRRGVADCLGVRGHAGRKGGHRLRPVGGLAARSTEDAPPEARSEAEGSPADRSRRGGHPDRLVARRLLVRLAGCRVDGPGALSSARLPESIRAAGNHVRGRPRDPAPAGDHGGAGRGQVGPRSIQVGSRRRWGQDRPIRPGSQGPAGCVVRQAGTRREAGAPGAAGASGGAPVDGGVESMP